MKKIVFTRSWPPSGWISGGLWGCSQAPRHHVYLPMGFERPCPVQEEVQEGQQPGSQYRPAPSS